MDEGKNKRLIVLSSPSGGGKSTLARHLLKKYKNLRFAISATTRLPRPKESNGIDYYFLNREEFINKLKNNEFVEHEEIYGNFYGTPKSEVDKAFLTATKLIFDVDVKGALSIRSIYPKDSLLIFLQPPSVVELLNRLVNRSTESPEQLKLRTERIEMELSLKDKFDFVITNDKLEDTFRQAEEILDKYMAE